MVLIPPIPTKEPLWCITPVILKCYQQNHRSLFKAIEALQIRGGLAYLSGLELSDLNEEDLPVF